MVGGWVGAGGWVEAASVPSPQYDGFLGVQEVMLTRSDQKEGGLCA